MIPKNGLGEHQSICGKRLIDVTFFLDSTQTAKNALDTLFQGKSAYGDFIADLDHLAEMAKYDDRTKVNMLRKCLNKRITGVIDNQVNLPASNNYTGWSDMINTIARNLQQQEHIAKLQAPTSTIQQNNPNEPNQNFEHDYPMDLSRIRLWTAEKNYRMENGLCVACGNSGHIAKDHHRKIDSIPMSRRSKNLTASRGNDNDNRPSPKQNFSPNQKIYHLTIPSLFQLLICITHPFNFFLIQFHTTFFHHTFNLRPKHAFVQ